LCAEKGLTVSLFSPSGRIIGRFEGPTTGNVLLRRDQHRASLQAASRLAIAKRVVLGKIANSRTVVLRGARDHGDSEGRLGAAAEILGRVLRKIEHARDLNELRGMEGEAGRTYFGVFDDLRTRGGSDFTFAGRSRRPPRDRVNALLSFAYGILLHDVRSACEGVGLDPQIGFLHADRPGRPGLALDLMEELRAPLADRAVLTVINRQQVSAADFEVRPGGAVRLNESARKALIVTYQKRKQDSLVHPFLGEETTVGLLPHLQARLLARHLRGDLDGYSPFLAR
jgi:CRISPR-associated protein Cas1